MLPHQDTLLRPLIGERSPRRQQSTTKHSPLLSRLPPLKPYQLHFPHVSRLLHRNLFMGHMIMVVHPRNAEKEGEGEEEPEDAEEAQPLCTPVLELQLSVTHHEDRLYQPPQVTFHNYTRIFSCNHNSFFMAMIHTLYNFQPSLVCQIDTLSIVYRLP